MTTTTVFKYPLDSTPENVEALASFLRTFESEELRQQIAEWSSVLVMLSDNVEIEESGLVWAGPETVKTLISRAQKSRDIPELASALKRAVVPIDGDLRLYIMAAPHFSFYWPVPFTEGILDEDLAPDYIKNEMSEQYVEMVARWARGESRESIVGSMRFLTLGPHKTNEVTLEMYQEEMALLSPIVHGNLWPRPDVNNIDTAVEEKLRVVKSLDVPLGHQPMRGMPDGTMAHLANATLVWVNEEMGTFIRKMAFSLPDTYVPEASDFGMLPSNMLVMFAGDHYRYNIWHVNEKTGNRVGLLPMRAGGLHHGGLQATWTFGTQLGEASLHFRQLFAFLLLANEPITMHHREHPSRAVARRVARTHKGAINEVVVVTLRRPKGAPAEEHGKANYSHSFIVNAHWRNQWYPSLNRHKPKLIHAYVKGDGPLVVKSRVIRLAR
jgi:hypothetical protein